MTLFPIPSVRRLLHTTPLSWGAALLSTLALSVAAAPAAARSPGSAERSGRPGFAVADTLEGNFLAAYVAGAARDTKAAATFYREALREDPRNPELLERAFISLLADGDWTGAAKAAERIVARDANNSLAQLALGVRALKAKQYGTARNFLQKGSKGRAADLTATLLSAWSYAGSGDGKRALEAAAGSRADRGFAIFRDYHSGLIAEVVGNAAEAERYLKAAYDAEKTTLRIVDAYGRLLSRRGRPEQALEVYRGFEALSPRQPFIRSAIAELTAGRMLPTLIATPQEGAAEVLYGLGSAGIQQGDELASMIYLQLALQLNPEHGLATVTLADVVDRLKRTEQAIDILRRVPANSPLKASADIQIGLDLEQLGRGEEAVRELDRLMKQRPDDNEVLVALGNVLRARKRYGEAAEVYGRAIARAKADEPGLWTLYYYRGTAFERAKDWPKAEADLQKALSLVPETQALGRSQVLNYLGYSWVDQNLNLDEAFKMLKRAVELNPRDGMIIDSLGWAFYRYGRYEEAVRELEKAAELKSGDPVINDHLGDAYWRVGRRLEAKFQWQHAKDAEPEPDDLKLIEIKLERGLEDEKPAEAARAVPAPDKSGG